MVFPRSSHNLLVVSDLHLGADLKRTGFAWLRGVATLDREFGRFLEWYAAHREGELPWRLLINGDMVDFINVTLFPSDEEAAAHGFEVSQAERVFGLSGEEAKVAWMLGRVVDRHRALFEKLAAFISAGNEIAILRGNHDVEFHFTAVQDRFKALLADVAAVEGDARADFLSRVEFLPWFYYEPGAIFVEHGNQYDEYSSFEYQLAPVSPVAPGRVDLPLSHFAIRYMVNKFQNIDTHDKDDWTMLDYFRFAATGEAGSAVSLLRGYFALVKTIGAEFIRRHRHGTDHAERTHRGAMAAIAAEWRLPVDVLAKLEKLHTGSALRSWWRTAQCYYVDRFAWIGFGAATIALLIALRGLTLAGVGSVIAASAGVVAVDRMLANMRNSLVPPKLARAGHAIATLLGVPLVVMGHSHHACIVQRGDENVRYVNTGTWIPPHDDARVGFTHARVLRVPGGVELELRRWNPRESNPERFDV